MSADPFKEMARRYDREVVKGGGSSIFAHKKARPVMVAIRDVLPWVNAPVAKPQWPIRRRGRNFYKPGRIVGRISGNLGGFIQDGFDDIGW
jgi:hypothetical protein